MDQSQLRQLLHYDKDAGHFTWLKRPVEMFKNKRSCSIWHTKFEGKKAGSLQKSGNCCYVVIVIHAKKYLAHRLAWLYETGSFPNDQVDHINGEGTDNRFVNLRDVSNAVNGRNCRSNSNKTSGVMGVYFYKRDGLWCSYITKNRKTTVLGRFQDKFEAICARKSAEVRMGFHGNHGRHGLR